MRDLYLPLIVLSLYFMDCNGQNMCERCTKPLLKLLEEVSQDIAYAEVIIDTDKLSDKLMTKIDELEETFEQHSIGFNESETMVSLANANLGRQINSHDPMAAGVIEKFIMDLEKETCCLNEKLVPELTYELEILNEMILKAQTLELDLRQIVTIIDYTDDIKSKIATENVQPVEDPNSIISIYNDSFEALCAQMAIDAELKSILSNLSEVDKVPSSKNSNLSSEDIPSLKFVRGLYDELTLELNNRLNRSSITSMTQAADVYLRKSLFNLKDRVVNSKTELLNLKEALGSPGKQSIGTSTLNGHDSILQAIQAILR